MNIFTKKVEKRMVKLPQKIQKDLPFLPLFLDEVEETRTHYVAKQAQYKKWTGSGMPLIVILAQVPNWFSLNGYNWLIFVALLIVVPAYIYTAKDYKRLFKENIYGYITETKNKNWTFENEPVEFDEIDKNTAGIFDGYIRLLKKYYNVTGLYNGYPTRITGINAAFRNQKRGSDKFKGTLIRIKLHEKLPYKLVIAPNQNYPTPNATGTNTLGLHQQGLSPQADLEASFAKYFKAYSTKENPPILSLTLQRQLVHFITNSKVQTHLYFVDDYLYISLRTNHEMHKIVLAKPELIEEAAKYYYEDLTIVDDLLKRLEQGDVF
jgi:hypothetical protein